MEIFIMKALFVLMCTLPVSKKMTILRKKVKFNFLEEDINEEDIQRLRPILEEGEKKK